MVQQRVQVETVLLRSLGIGGVKMNVYTSVHLHPKDKVEVDKSVSELYDLVVLFGNDDGQGFTFPIFMKREHAQMLVIALADHLRGGEKDGTD